MRTVNPGIDDIASEVRLRYPRVPSNAGELVGSLRYPVTMAQTRSAGWYPAPDGNGQQWWNGLGWSDTRLGASEAAASVPVAAVVPGTVPAPPPPVYSAANPPPLVPGATPFASPFSARTVNARVNRNAMVGFVTGIISVFFNVLFVLAPIAIVFSIMGLSRARRLRAQGATNTLGVYAWIGLATGVFSALASVIQVVLFLVSMFGLGGASALFPASGLLPRLLLP